MPDSDQANGWFFYLLGGVFLPGGLLLLLLLWHLVGARVVGLLATESCLLGSRVLPPITGAA